ncbi:MAG: hypothetical protein ACKVQS_02265 [Fimbriimonadaceae bacterium]
MKYATYFLATICLCSVTLARADNPIDRSPEQNSDITFAAIRGSQEFRFEQSGKLSIRQIRSENGKKQTASDLDFVPAPGRVFVARDWKVTLTNAANYEIKISGVYDDGKPLPERTIKSNNSLDISSEFDQTITISSDEHSQSITILAARKLKAITKIGAGFAYNFGDDFGSYQLVPKVGDPSKKVVEKADQRNFNGNLTGQIYLPFDDEAWLASPGVARLLTFGLFDPSHHRLGLMAGIATKDDIDPTYQIGICWLLDRDGTAVLSYGLSFRSRNVLLQGIKEGQEFAGETLPTRKEFKPLFFIGVSFNIGT